MISILIGLFFLAFATVLIMTLSSFKELSINEYKRRARLGSHKIRKIYQVLIYGKQLDIIFWLFIGVLTSSSLAILINTLPVWLVVIGFGIYACVSYGYLYQKKSKIGITMVKLTASPLSKLLEILQPFISFIEPISNQNILQQKIYEAEDLLSFIDAQKTTSYNRIDKTELDKVISSLMFQHKLVHTVMTPLDNIVSVNVNDDIGPILMEELHKSGHSIFPVYQSKKQNIIGSLSINNILEVKKGGMVKDYIDKRVFYVNSENTLEDVMRAIITTSSNLFIVIDKSKEIVGIMSTTDIFEQIVGSLKKSEDIQFDNITEVANQFDKKVFIENDTEVIE